MQSDPARSILFIDPDKRFLTSVLLDPKVDVISPYAVFMDKEAQAVIADKKHRFLAVFLNPKIDPSMGLSILRSLRIHRPATPVCILYDSVPALVDEDQNVLLIHEWVRKPVSYTEILDRISPLIAPLDPAAVLADTGEGILAEEEISADDTRFQSTAAEDFLPGTKSMFNVYVRLNEHRYMKVLKARETLKSNRLLAFIRKGISHLYVDKSEQAHYLASYDQMTSRLARNESQPPSNGGISDSLVHGREVLTFLQSLGIGPIALKGAQDYAATVDSLVRSLRLDQKNEFVAKYLKDPINYEHAISATMIAGLMCHALDITGNTAIQVVGLATLFHDIGLEKIGVRNYDESSFDLNDGLLEAYQTHPTVGAEILEKLPGVSPAVIQAIAQHHERRDRKGFPSQAGPGSINRIAEIVGICDEFIRVIGLAKKIQGFDIKEELQTKVFNGFSGLIVEAFKLVFF